ncbi:MAG TPA: class I SAM-dependent methyltransferase [Ignavibacteria bacterium]|nr:class I SAM-dependent methyltransferase [Ignavibacteria bacterium]
MKFKYKAYLQNFFSSIPQGERINYFFQKHITHTLPINDQDFSVKVDTVINHVDNFRKYGNEKDIENCKYYEFGSGYDMVIPMGVSLLGFESLTCIDIRELVFPDLINDSIKRLFSYKDKFGSRADILKEIPLVNRKNYREILRKNFKINYLAPLDARKTGIESNSIDFILSNATMEHIPEIHLPDILKECLRILKPGGIMSNAIDYRDHYSFFDNSVSVYNYLQYSENQWNKLNPSIMYQNRLRHKDYVKIILDTGFEIIDEKPDFPDDSEISSLKNTELDEFYRENYNFEELSIKSCMIVLRKN